MKRLTILLLIGFLLVGIATAGIVNQLSASNTDIDYEPRNQTRIDASTMVLDSTGEVKCNDDLCWVKVYYTTFSDKRQDYVGLKEVNKDSLEKDIESARAKAIKEWSLEKADLITIANVGRNKTTETKLGVGNITSRIALGI